MEKYIDERDRFYLEKLRSDILPSLPRFCGDFFVGISSVTTVLTRYNYATDLRVFFDYIVSDGSVLEGEKISEITFGDLNHIESIDIERFVDYLSGYTSVIDGQYVKDAETSKARKLSAVRSLFKYLYNHDCLDKNVAAKVSMPKLREKEIIRLDNDEVDEVFDMLDDKNSFVSPRQNSYNNNNTKIRDNAIITLLLGTGIRVSECVGLNVKDINFKNKTFLVTRKGEKESILYLNDEIIAEIDKYLKVRNARLIDKKIQPQSVDALFLSLRDKRITPRAVELIVKKYARIVTPLKHITPHKLRSTYGTALYRETGDIYAVAEILGHRDVNTTKKHYAATGEDIKKSASGAVNFRKKHNDSENGGN
jgi:site-specific recombinase XerD